MSSSELSSSSSSSSPWWRIDRRLVPMKAHFFLCSAACAPVVPFMATYARQLGFSAVIVGVLYAVMPFAALFGRLLFGYVADRFRARKTLILVGQVVMAAAFLGLRFVRPHAVALHFEYQCGGDATTDQMRFCPLPANPCMLEQLEQHRGQADQMQCWITCDETSTSFEVTLAIDRIRNDAANCLLFDAVQTDRDCRHERIANCSGTCTSNANIQHLLGQHQQPDESSHSQLPPQLIVFACCMIVGTVAIAVVESLTTTVCFALLGDNPYLYGRQRLFGSVGYGCSSLVAGLLLDHLSGPEALLKDYSGAFYMMLGLVALDLCVAGAGLRNLQTVRCPTIVRNVGRRLLTPHCALFFGWCATVGMLTSLVWTFLFWHLEELADAAGEASETCGGGAAAYMKTLQGLVLVVQTFVGELPWFFASGALIRRIGHGNAMSVVLAGYGCRLLLYSALRNPWWVLPIGSLAGVTFSLAVAVMSTYAAAVAPGGAEATMQAVAGTAFEGVGVSLGGVLGGVAMARLGGEGTFRLFGCVAWGLCGLHVLARWLLGRWCPERVEQAVETSAAAGASSESSVDDSSREEVDGQMVAVQRKY